MRLWVSTRIAPGVRVGVSVPVGNRRRPTQRSSATRYQATSKPARKNPPAWIGFVFVAGIVAGIGVWFSLWWLALGIPMWTLFWLCVIAGAVGDIKADNAAREAKQAATRT